ncbi:ABC transporter ATP-binding protein [Nonomuraea cavernae]|uniref:ABC transporter ATP-binding protein n=1 Tax=Nonomuraea cavernae TaxID=2045107 RepID=A0A918DH43_9ACTN|nr:ABC transporter ATP-binding protein [Nonomuraea cavernae]MCA2185499.1 ABC transporter ATP-binding protein [Nonomuraea cavernae]GGO66656.1 ABC transporter ATP-binding protein [Nonomuraea cavernae]
MTATAQDHALLELRGIVYKYGAISALRDVDLSVRKGEAVCVIGPNGAGKTTLARVAGGLYRPAKGEVLIGGEPLPRSPHDVVVRGIGSVLEGRHLFVEQTVTTNLELGCYRSGLDKATVEQRLEKIMTLFPVLRERAHQRTSTMSGGEQQMVAIGRALMAEPQILILDEPSMGLAPKITGEVFDALASLREGGLSILLIEQNAPLAFELADRGYLMRQGAVVVEGSIDELTHDDVVRSAYLGA